MSDCDFERLPAGVPRESSAALGTAGTILRAMVSAAFGLPAQALDGDSRGRADVAFARQVAMYLAHTRLHLPYVVAGQLFDRDRTTARHACRQVEERRDDPRVDAIVDYLERAVDIWPGRNDLSRP